MILRPKYCEVWGTGVEMMTFLLSVFTEGASDSNIYIFFIELFSYGSSNGVVGSKLMLIFVLIESFFSKSEYFMGFGWVFFVCVCLLCGQ